MDIDRKTNRTVLEQISFHLDEAMRLCSQLDFSNLGSLEQKEWIERIKLCKDALEFTKGSAQRLNKLLST